MLAMTSVASAQFETRGISAVGPGPSSIAVGDFNHDGKLDIAAVTGETYTNNVAILLGNGDGTFQPAIYCTVGVGPVSIVAADFNHDGNLDLAMANSYSSYISVLMGNGDGTFLPSTQSPPVPTGERFVTVGDFNGDGKLDLVANTTVQISVLLGNGDGTFQQAVTIQPGFYVDSIGVGDFNRDGKLDIATAGNFSVNIFLGNGDGTFQYGASYPGEEAPVAIAVADFNGDHKLDLAIANSEGGTISVLLGNGDGTFQPAVDYPLAFTNWVTAADVNGDHKIDLVAANSILTSSELTVFLGNGDGTFQFGKSYPAGIEAYYVAAGDFNGDGKTDLATPDNLHQDVIVLLNTGVVAFSPTVPLAFKKQKHGTTSAPQTVTLTNTGRTELKISSMKPAGQFNMTSTCREIVAPGANCTINVTFSPKTQGAKSGTVTINDGASSKPQVIELSGTGT
jgi:FG-GAP-like repeat/Abnormal spindle-like microcephaly-assoc'd, ASPM-SPD-2-Hydin